MTYRSEVRSEPQKKEKGVTKKLNENESVNARKRAFLKI